MQCNKRGWGWAKVSCAVSNTWARIASRDAGSSSARMEEDWEPFQNGATETEQQISVLITVNSHIRVLTGCSRRVVMSLCVCWRRAMIFVWPKIGEIVILFRVAWSSSSSSSSSQSLGLFLVCISANKDMERVNIRQQNLDELYQTPENTLESKHPRPTFLHRPPVPACRSTNFSLFSSWGT